MMTMHSLRRRVLLCLAGASVGVLGCSNANSNNLNNASADARPRRNPALAYQYDYSNRMPARTGIQPAAPQQAQVAQQPAAAQPQQAVVIQSLETMPAGDAVVVSQDKTPPASLPAEMPIQAQGGVVTQLPATVDPMNAEAGPPHVVDIEGAVQTIDRKAINPEDSFHDRRNPAPRRAFVDLTAQPWFSHAPDYSWLAGQLHFSKSNTSWLLRYASLDENDPYDGEVTLVDYPQVDCLRDGQYVRVSGHLDEPERKEFGSHYRVSSMQPIQNPSDPIAAGSQGNVRPAGLSK
jgi:hypothetical protein